MESLLPVTNLYILSMCSFLIKFEYEKCFLFLLDTEAEVPAEEANPGTAETTIGCFIKLPGFGPTPTGQQPRVIDGQEAENNTSSQAPESSTHGGEDQAPALPLVVQAEGSNTAPASPVTADVERSQVVSLLAVVLLHHSPEAPASLNIPRTAGRLSERPGTMQIQYR